MPVLRYLDHSPRLIQYALDGGEGEKRRIKELNS
jgi:hypothetical protein